MSDNLVSQIFKNELTAKTIGAQFDILNRTLKLDGEPDVWIVGRGD
ncbi:MAG TPA: hypothetical protein VJY42_02335 [Candidatus Methanomethylophilaceae archaeon]|nr:hypothetical protein [Candidatus Methanomethylophilaceae archaeon]